MRFIKLRQIHFGDVFLSVDAIGAVIPASSDPGHQKGNGCCVVVHGDQIRVQETFDEVMALLNPAESLLADPAPPLKALVEGHVAKPKKGAKGK